MATDPKNVDWQRGLYVAHDNLGLALREQGDYAAARGELTKALELARTLAASVPDNPRYRADAESIQNDLDTVSEKRRP